MALEGGCSGGPGRGVGAPGAIVSAAISGAPGPGANGAIAPAIAIGAAAPPRPARARSRRIAAACLPTSAQSSMPAARMDANDLVNTPLGAGASLEAPEEKSARRLQRQPSIVKLNHVS